ncbi:hypothetical protein KC19_11G141500 [Ceratodon purpureus]|uniref:Ubiquinol oxidase n=1 Tax=Ceratodon purpureus TaxID=3225 RepID=A0A8T0GDT5_CERPU|nr:hypothetical protein KC19_11G141500 [Ceratodon purpureus]
MRGRVGSLLVREAMRQATRYGGQRAFSSQRMNIHHANSVLVKTAVDLVNCNLLAPSLSLSSGRFADETRAWSPFVHQMSTAAAEKKSEEEMSTTPSPVTENMKKETTVGSENRTEISNYWGVAPKVHVKEDRTPWKWPCFTLHETYYADVKIDLEKHHPRKSISDSIAYWGVKSMRIRADLFFQKRYTHRVMMLQTIAAVPGMVGGMLLHCKSLRRFETSGGWIKALLEEAENERMHLMTWMEVAQPKWWERALVFAVGTFFNAYFLLYLASPRLAHRVTGYLEEEVVWSDTQFLKEIDAGRIPNGPGPAIAIDYWRLPKNATLRDVVEVVRADEAHHRDVNHFAADIHEGGKELREAHAPIGYH